MTSGNPLFDRGNPRDKGAHGRKAEKKTAKRLGGKLQPGSGALDGAKGDFTVNRFLIENKATEDESFTLKQSWLLKIYSEALACGKVPALSFQFVRPSGQSETRDRWVAIPEHLFKDLTDGD